MIANAHQRTMDSSDFEKPFLNINFPDSEVNHFNAKIARENFELLQTTVMAIIASMDDDQLLRFQEFLRNNSK